MLHNRKSGLRTVISAVLVLALLLSCCLGLFGCGASTDAPPASTTTQPTTTTPPPTTTVPPETQPSVEIVVNNATLTYEMTEADVTEFYNLLAQSEDLAINSTDAALVDEVTDKLDEKYEYLETQHSIATILYYSDLTDEAASKLYLDCTETVTQANNDYLIMARNVYLSDSPHKDMLFEGWTEEDFAFLMAYTEEVMQLQQRNSEIEVAYQSLQNSPDLYEGMVPLYIEMVQNNNRIAQIYGYDNYYEYAYELVYARDYEHDKIVAMRTYAAQYLVPALSGALSKFNSGMRKLSERYQETLIGFLYNSYVYNSEPYVNRYLATLPEGMQADMLDMFDGNIVMKDTANGAQEGAFTTSIGPDQLVCYFGPGYSNAMTIVHEVGHYYGGTHTDLQDIPLDLAEVQSQGNEWLFLSYLKTDMSGKIYETMVDYRMYSDIAQILICVMVDEFEERVYTHPDIASLTSADLDAIMADVASAYGGVDRLSATVTNIQEYWRMVVVEQPVYYISYAVSSLAAMDIYATAGEDYNQAIEVYRQLNEEVKVEDGFLGNLNNAGIASPFEEDVYKRLHDMFA